jgi:Tfp pilus assembly protein PilX
MIIAYSHNIRKRRRLRRGMAYILSLVVLSLCTTMAVAMASGTSVNLTRSENMQNALNAQLAAEGGLQFLLQSIASTDMPKETTQETLMGNLAAELGGILDDTANLSGAVVSAASTTVTIPAISVEGSVFTCVLTRIDPDTEGNLRCRLSVTGSSGGMSRSISVDLCLKSSAPGVFDYGIATKGTIDISGNAKILSMSDPSDANVFTAADDAIVIDAAGNSKLDGDLYACTDEISAIRLTGNSQVGGETDTDLILTNHTHLGISEPEFPEFDLTPFPGLTTDVVDSSTRTSGNKTFNNIHILPNANPTFNGNITLNGIVYIEAPNNVKFNGNLVINGMVVTSDGGSTPFSGNQLTFNGNVSVPGVDALPDTAQFQDVKAMTGTAILAPGFGVTFKGNNGGINGLVAADQLIFRGNTSLGGDLTGVLLGLADRPMELRGNTTITINRPDGDYTPAGFKYTSSFEVVANSYAESTP